MEDVKKAWWQTWANERLSEFIPRPPKWSSTSMSEPVAGGVVLFTQEESDGTFGDLRWRVGIVEEVIKGSDGICRQVRIRYRNAGERAFRTTKPAVRRVALLHSEAELCLVDELNAAAKATNVDYTREHPDGEEDVTSQAVAPSLPPTVCCCCW